MTISQTVNNYVAGLNAFKAGQEYKIGKVSYSVEFDPSSYNEVLLFWTEENSHKAIQFACTDFGIYIRDEDVEQPSHYFYHSLMYTRDFGFNLNDLANVHYIFKEMKNT